MTTSPSPGPGSRSQGSPAARARSGENPYRLLPSVEEVLAGEAVQALAERMVEAGQSRRTLTRFVQETLEAWRAEIKAGTLDADVLWSRLAAGGVLHALEQRVEREQGSGIRRAINGAGVVLHTGLGRAPVHPEAAEAMAAVAGGYCVLEVDRWTGRRNHRDGRLSDLLAQLTGAEAGIAVNNNAAAVLLTLNTFAAGQGTVVSRGELVEIGGSFRMPDVMERAGTHLVEVGTTNRTRLSDFRGAFEAEAEDPQVGGLGLFYKVHESNFRVVGFTEAVDATALAELGRELGVSTAYDLGSGLLEPDGATPLSPLLGDEPLVRPAVESGVDVVSFSGDKLLGGPQAGLLVGRAEAVARLRKNPLYRALRLDKVAIAGLEKTLELLLAGRGDEIPARAMMIATKAAMRERAESLAEELAALPGVDARVVEDATQPGSGSAPGVFLPTWVVRVAVAGLGAEELASRLRANDPPVFVRIADDIVHVDPRTFLGDDRGLFTTAVLRIADAARAEGGDAAR